RAEIIGALLEDADRAGKIGDGELPDSLAALLNGAVACNIDGERSLQGDGTRGALHGVAIGGDEFAGGVQAKVSVVCIERAGGAIDGEEAGAGNGQVEGVSGGAKRALGK